MIPERSISPVVRCLTFQFILFLINATIDTKPSIIGSVPIPKVNMKANPSIGVGNVTQKDRARKVRPQGRNPFSEPSSKSDAVFLR
jgi:hypothetical protein